MQTKVVIGTIAFMLTMIIFGFATLLEPARLQETTEAFEGRQIENGAALFQNNCATCHGIEGKAEQCFDVGGNQIGCAGLPLKSIDLLCTDATGKSARMQQLNWAGSQHDFIFQTIAAGRLGTLMPTWSEEFGGSLGQHEIEQLTLFVLNWSGDAGICAEGVVVEQVEWPASVAELPEGDPANGPDLYSLTYGCIGCHGDLSQPGSNLVGPHLGNIGNVAAERVAGQTAAEYIYESIVSPDAFIAPTCVGEQPCLEPSRMMGANLAGRMSLQDVADMVAYLLEQTNP